jgi:hypothetical protein
MIIISPNLGETGAPQLGHLSETTPDGAMTSLRREGPEEETLVAVARPTPACVAGEGEIADPHL